MLQYSQGLLHRKYTSKTLRLVLFQIESSWVHRIKLKLADKIEKNTNETITIRRPHGIINEIDSETPSERNNAENTTAPK